MKSRTWMWTTVVYLLAALAMPLGMAAQDNPTKDRLVITDDHDRGPQNGDLAVSATTVVDGGYGAAEIATLPNDGGPYHFLTTVEQIPNGALNPDFTPDGKTIFFWSFGAPDLIYSVSSAGGPITQVNTHCVDDPNCLADDNPAISPDGRELLTLRAIGPFDENGCAVFVGIFKFRIDGSHPRKVSTPGPPCSGDWEPRWSPSGHQIVFQHEDPAGLLSIGIMDRDGSHRRQITPAGNNFAGFPSWSPDGERIVFQSPDQGMDDQNPQQLYTIHPDGSHLRQITHYAIVPGLVVKTNAARWSPDGRKIVFAHLDATTTVGPDGLHHSDLFEMNPDGSDVVQINFTPEKDNNPAWGARRGD
jgi:Tol biopolymer transport system component